MPMTRTQFLAGAGVEATTLEVWLEQRWIVPDDDESGPVFSELDLARARLIHELQHGMGANEAGVDFILHLIDQLHAMRGALDEVRREMADGGRRTRARKPRGGS